MVEARTNSSYAIGTENPTLIRRIADSLSASDSWQRRARSLQVSLVAIGAGLKTGPAESWRRRDEMALEKYEAMKGLISRRNALVSLPFIALFLLAFLPAAILGSGFQGVFNSPDETTRYLAAETFAETGQLYIEDEITLSNPEYATGPRGYAQHNGRSIPTYSPALLLFFGILSSLFGTAAPFVLATIPGALFVTLAIFVRRLLPSAPIYLPWIFLGVTPLWYWTSRVYMDLSLTFLFVAVALVLLTRAIQIRSERHLFYGAVALGLAALSRIPEAPLLFMFGGAFVLGVGHQLSANRNGIIRLGVIYGAALFASFIVPLMILNWWANGSPTTVSYTLLFEQHFPELVAPASNVLLEPFRIVWLAMFPQPVDFRIIYATFTYQGLLQNPYLFFLGAVGLVQSGGLVTKKLGGYGAGVLLITFIYMLLSRNAPGTFLAGTDEPDLRASLVRYWMPLYMLLGVGAVLALHRMPHRVSLLLVVAFVVSSAYGIWYTGQESISNLERNYGTNSVRYEQFFDENTEPHALVVAGSSFDKFTVPYRRTIGIWPDTATETNLRHLADTGADAVRRGTPVYYMFGPNEPDNVIEIMNKQLDPQFMGLTLVASPTFAGDLWKITSNPQSLELSAIESDPADTFVPPFGGGFGAPTEPTGGDTSGVTEFQSSFVVPGRSFTVNVDSDGSARNLIANPSFETNADLWGGPNAQGPVDLSDEVAIYGNSSLRMELSPAPKSGERVRRTHSLTLGDLRSGSWNLRAMVNVEELSDASVEMIVFIDRADGTRIDRISSKLESESAEWQELVINGPAHLDAAKLSIQISVVASAEGGYGVTYWDGIELIDGTSFARQYCDGDHFGCTWEGEPHASASSRSGGVSELTAVGSNSDVEITEPLRSGDQVLFEDGFAVVHRVGGSTDSLGYYGEINPEEVIELTIIAESEPVITVIGN